MAITPLITTADIIARTEALGIEITRAYKGRQPLLIGALKGSFMFMADLVRRIDLPVSIDFVGASSRPEGTESTGKVVVTKGLSESIEGKDVILIEDIIDTGLTASFLIQMFEEEGAASVKVCSLLHKPARTQIPVDIHFLGFTIEDKFVVGYGLDYSQKYRNIPYIGILDESKP
jgi:hypoxanthine phosphoribosyltransferase